MSTIAVNLRSFLMKRLSDFMKSLRLGHLVTVLMAVTLLLVTAACGTTETASYDNSEAGKSQENVAENLSDFRQELEDLGAEVQTKVEEATGIVKEEGGNMTKKAKRQLEDTADVVKQEGGDMAKEAKRQLEDTADVVKEKVGEAKKSAQRTIEDVSDAADS
ncbi:hypothetical protein NIES39_L00010 [Arthrospira platensis NIES-39]|nr:hypothetical protein NIES39_L00010 [Arthrospira platensis NIES-39]